MLGKMAKEMAKTNPNATGDENGDLMDEAENGNDTEENGDNEVEDNTNVKVSDEQIVELSVKLAENWEKLAPKLGVADDKLKEIKDKDVADHEKCLELLKLWQEIEGEGATKDEIVYILEGLKLASSIEGVF